ncbi:MAG: YhdP family protein [Methylobacter sp.]|nr:YhdP family protein [Methylobacter sp.]
MIHHITRATRHLIFWSLVSVAVSLTGIRLLLAGIESYKADLAANISELLDVPVKIGHLGAKMRGFSPELVLKDIVVLPAVKGGKFPIQLKEIRLGIHLLDMLVNRDLLSSSWITLVGAKLSIKRKPDGSFAIVGLKAGGEQPVWLLQGSKFEVLESDITWQDEKRNGRPLKFEDVDLAIMNDAQRHQVNMLMKLPEKYGDALRISMDFNGNAFAPSAMHGTVFIEGKNIKLPELMAIDLPFAMNINSGTGDFKVWSDWQYSQPVSVKGEAQLQQLKFIRNDKNAFLVSQLKTGFHWRLTDRQWQLDVKDFLLETADRKWPVAAFSVSANRAEDHALHKIALFAEQLDLQQATDVVQFFVPLTKEQSEFLTQAHIRGLLEKFSLFADMDEKSFAVNGKFAGIRVASMSSLPGIENLTGRIKGSDKQGILRVVTEDARIILPNLFRKTLPISTLEGTLAWQQSQDDWVLSSQLINLDAPGFQSKNRIRLNIPKTEGKVFMDMQSSFASNDVSLIAQYLPAGIMHGNVVNWLDHAFVNGRVTKGGLLISGNLKDFPFTRGEGVFEALFDVEQLELAYHPQWPAITDMAAEVLFLQNSLKVDVHQGQSNKAIIKQAEVTIPALGKSEHLLIQGEIEGEIRQISGFMQQTPLNTSIDTLLDAIAPEGATQIALTMKIPLLANARTKVDGTARLSNVRLKVQPLDLWVNKIEGELKFNERGVFSDTIHAVALNHPIRINISNSASQAIVNIAGNVEMSDLQEQFKIPGLHKTEGATDYKLRLALPYDGNSPELVLESTLLGVALDLPGALAKTGVQTAPSSLSVSLSDKFLLPVLLNYDNKLKAAVKVDVKQQSIYSGHVLIGAGNVTQTQEAGLKLEINRNPLALQDWLSLAVAQEKEGETGAGINLREIKIQTDQALWKRTELGIFDLTLKREGDYWAGDISSSFAKGKIQIPIKLKGADSINLNMDWLDMAALKQLKFQNDSPESAPEFLPLFNITSRKTLWQSVDLGQLKLTTERIPEGIVFKNMELVGADEELTLSGDWKVNGKHSETHTHGHLEMPRAGRLFAQLGITKDLMETAAIIDFTVDWKGAPYQFSLPDLKGEVAVNLSNGRILSIEPGFGRLLGMLALAQWIKRLQLDFSDVYEEGLTFNSIKGRFDLSNGMAVTHNLVVDAVPAKITIIGDTDLVNGTVDHIVNVSPKSAEAVPIAGTIMGKVAGLVARSLTGEEQEGFFFGSQYLVKGGWGDAQIIPLHENDGLLQKTWNGLTDFAWLKQQKK